MGESEGDIWIDGAAGRLVRPYTVSNGRTQPSVAMDLLSMVIATGHVPNDPLEPDHENALRLCEGPTTVAEVAAHLRLPAAITKIVLSDLVDCHAVRTRAPYDAADITNRFVLERVLDGLQRRL